MKSLLQKLKSRKFWMALIPAVAGVVLAFGADATVVGQISGALMALVSAMSYIITEGKIDEAAARLNAVALDRIVDSVLDDAVSEE